MAAHGPEFPRWTPGFVKLLLPPRQSRGISYRISLQVTGHISGVSSSTAGAFTPARFAAVLQLSFTGPSPLIFAESRFSGDYVNDSILLEDSVNAETLSLDPANLNIIEHFSARVFPDTPYFLDAALILQTASLAQGAGGPLFSNLDFGDTAKLQIELPNGVTFASASGVLLTQPVPLPAALYLFGPALAGGLSFARRLLRNPM